MGFVRVRAFLWEWSYFRLFAYTCSSWSHVVVSHLLLGLRQYLIFILDFVLSSPMLFSFCFLVCSRMSKGLVWGYWSDQICCIFWPSFPFLLLCFRIFCVTYGLDMFDCRHLSIFGVKVKKFDFRAKRGLKVHKRGELGNKCGLVRFPTALDPHFIPNPRHWKNRARARV